MSEKLCLQWNDFRENALGSLGSLKNDRDFLDVTLISEDGKQVEAHKVILAISSPFFQNLLKRNKHPHPLIYMRGVKSEDLLAIVDFLYFGEANVNQENLDSFLALAEELQLQGLMGNVYSDGSNKTNAEPTFQEKKNRLLNSNPSISKALHVSRNDANGEFSHTSQDDKSVALTRYFSGNMQELDEKCNSMMEKTLKKMANGLPLYKCVACGKEGVNGNLKKHIEANHLEGISIPCDLCQKTFRSRKTMREHRRYQHRSN